MNYFYAPPEQWNGEQSVEIIGQEAQHILKVLRYNVGDTIHIANGRGRIYECKIESVAKQLLTATIGTFIEEEAPKIAKVLALGVIKIRDRFEFAIEKAVELGATEICIFNADHTQRTKINEGRLNLLILSAFKQSGRFWLPDLVIKDSLDEVYSHYKNHSNIMAHEKTTITDRTSGLIKDSVLFVGPEGGFSERELKLHSQNGGEFISLGKNRLRAETAVTALLSQYLFS
ncbi:MAG: RsmE family RNA methyltransferase [Balneolaceae bacterium]